MTSSEPRDGEKPVRSSRTVTPRWFLDIDGTISPYGLTEPWSGPTLFHGPSDSDLAVPYRDDVIKQIQRLHDTGLVEVVWLTTWDPDTIAAWSEVGLGPFPITPRRRSKSNRWWKADTVATWMRKHPDRRVIWTDDDISTGGLRGLDRTRLLAIRPDRGVGLTGRDLARIRRWAENS